VAPDRKINIHRPPGEMPEPPPPETNKIPDTPKTSESRLVSNVEAIDSRPRRNRFLHWSGFVLALISFLLLVNWMVLPETALKPQWFWLDIGISILSAFEFFTRSGFRWDPVKYVRGRFFDFVAIAPALLLIYYDVPFLWVWVWIILVARFVRAVDRLLGDGFFQRNTLAMVGAFEEEISDRVLLRLMERVEEDMERGKFGPALADSLTGNKEKVLERIRQEHPQQGLTYSLARITGADIALERIEERVYDSVVAVLGSNEIEKAVQEGIKSTFAVMKAEIAVKSWRQKLGIKRL